MLDGRNMTHDSAFFLQTVSRNQTEYGTAYDFGRAVSENAFNTRIPVGRSDL
jgi:hypothetical protein